MDSEAPSLDPERQTQARRYASIRRRWMVLEMLLVAAYLGLCLATGWGSTLRRTLVAALPGAANWWLVLLGTAAGLGLPWLVASLPLGYHTGFRLPHRYGLSTQTVGGWVTDQLKGLGVAAVLGAPLLLGLYALIGWQPGAWWLWAAALYTLVTAVLAALAPVLLLPLFFKLTPLRAGQSDLKERLMALAARAGTRIEGVYSLDMSRRTRAANAGLTGLGRTRRIVIGDTLLDQFTPDEIETVLAHELGHQVHRDIPLGLAIEACLNLAGFLVVQLALGGGVRWFQLAGPADPAGLPWIGLLLGGFGLVTMPLSNAYSRWRESLADDFALDLTHKPGAFASAMTRLANQNLAEAEPPRWVVALLYSHPPLQARIDKANFLERKGSSRAVGTG
jgi:STE24 endopeptidase